MDEEKKSGPPPRWEEFVKAKYKGGKTEVDNPNPNTKEVFPKVKFTTALKFKPFLDKVLKEYHAWVGKDSKGVEEGSQSPKPVDIDTYAKMWENRDDLIGEYRTSILNYTGTDYAEINDHLRLGEPASRKIKEMVADIDAAFKVSKSPAPIVAYRTLSKRNVLTQQFLAGELKEGTVLEDTGYVSTTLDPNYHFKPGLKLVMSVPKGYPAIWVDEPPSDDWTANPGEKEVILKRNTRMKVTKVTDKEVHVQVLMDEPSSKAASRAARISLRTIIRQRPSQF